MKTDPAELPNRWRKILERVAAGEEFVAAALAEKCSKSYAQVIQTRMKKHPAAVKLLEEIRAKGVAMAAFGLQEALQQAWPHRIVRGAHIAARH